MGKTNRRGRALALGRLDADDVRNDFARFFDDHDVADPHVLALDFVGIVQAGSLDDRAGQLDRRQIGHRRDCAGLAHLHADVEQPGRGFVLLELVGDQPARALAGRAQPLALGEVVDLEHQAIDFEIELVQPLDQFLAMGDGRLEIVEAFDVRRWRQPVAAQLGQEIHVVRGLAAPRRSPRRGRTTAAAGGQASRGSSRRIAPEAQLRVLANKSARRVRAVLRSVAPGRSWSCRLRRALRAPAGGLSASRSGTSITVRMLCVMSSPVRPSPRVAAWTSGRSS